MTFLSLLLLIIAILGNFKIYDNYGVVQALIFDIVVLVISGFIMGTPFEIICIRTAVLTPAFLFIYEKISSLFVYSLLAILTTCIVYILPARIINMALHIV